MESTCDVKKCMFAKKHWIKDPSKGRCPSYIESWWKPEGEGKAVLIGDCAPRRSFLMIQELSNRLVGVQQSQEQMRNAFLPLKPLLEKVEEEKLRLTHED